MKGTLYIQLDKQGRKRKDPTPLECKITLAKDGQAIAGDGMILAAMTQARVVFIAADGVLLSGLIDALPYPKLQYQEWWFELEEKDQ